MVCNGLEYWLRVHFVNDYFENVGGAHLPGIDGEGIGVGVDGGNDCGAGTLSFGGGPADYAIGVDLGSRRLIHRRARSPLCRYTALCGSRVDREQSPVVN